MKYFADYSNKYLPCLKASYAHYQDAFHCSVGEHFKFFLYASVAYINFGSFKLAAKYDRKTVCCNSSRKTPHGRDGA